MENTKNMPETFKSESSIIVHPYKFPQNNQLILPTWALLVILIITFFILKFFIYIADQKRHGK
ncbi:MAG TPA: hypothetical protein VNJ08_04480 [Bacteriovoracaceae bacterium]|nr:hypothetical protein [Bacteriovoracaceae bacterium]